MVECIDSKTCGHNLSVDELMQGILQCNEDPCREWMVDDRSQNAVQMTPTKCLGDFQRCLIYVGNGSYGSWEAQ